MTDAIMKLKVFDICDNGKKLISLPANIDAKIGSFVYLMNFTKKNKKKV